MSKAKKDQVHVRVGVGVIVKDPDPAHPHQFFAGIRKGSHGSGLLALPGGHLELMESWEECATREVEEETGLKVHDVQFLHVTNDPMPSEHKHYITIFMTAKCQEGYTTPKNLEPHKCEGWGSYSMNDLHRILNNSKKETPESGSEPGPEPGLHLFGPLKHLVEESPSGLDVFLS